jgi:hypothetical protein
LVNLRTEYLWTPEEQAVISRFLKVAEQEFLAEKTRISATQTPEAASPSVKKAIQGAMWAHYHVREIRRQWEGADGPVEAVRGD